MEDKKGTDLLKDFFWNLLIYVLVFAYSFIMILLFHMIFYVSLHLNWTIAGIKTAAFIIATVFIVIKVVHDAVKK